MEYENLQIEQQGPIQIIKINRPQSLNALNFELLSDLDCAFSEAGADAQTEIIILSGEGKAFVAGADIAKMAKMNAIEGKEFSEFGSEVFRRIELLNKVVIAAVNGYALGGGCELCMACDLRIASVKAKFGQPEVGLGIIPGFSGTQRLARLVGVGKAKELIYTASTITAEEALSIGLINEVTEPENLMAQACAMAEKILSKGKIAVSFAKEAINRGIETDLDTAIAMESNLFGLCFSSEDQKEGMQAFLEKRKPNWLKK